MDKFWLKMVVLAVVVVAVVVIVKTLPPSEPKPEPKTFGDVIREDDKRLRADAEFDEVAEEPNEEVVEVEEAVEVVEVPKVVVEEVEVVKPQFRELSEIEEIEAEQLFEFALNQRKIGRVPVTGFKPMVDACRKIISKFPDSVYAFKAKRMLGDIPKRYRRRYKITDEEIDLGNLK